MSLFIEGQELENTIGNLHTLYDVFSSIPGMLNPFKRANEQSVN